VTSVSEEAFKISDLSIENWSLKICHRLSQEASLRQRVHHRGDAGRIRPQSLGGLLGRPTEGVDMTNDKFSMTNSHSFQSLKFSPRHNSTQEREMRRRRPLPMIFPLGNPRRTAYLDVMANPPKKKIRAALMLGIGVDSDGHKRLTTGSNFALIGGTEETHQAMTEKAIKINEHLASKGKRLEDVTREEFEDIAHSVGLRRQEGKGGN
jgi:hypothetical protein